MVERLEFMRRGQAVSLTLRELSQVLQIRDRGDSPCRHVTELLDTIEEIDERIRELRGLRRDLCALRASAADLDPTDCPPKSVCRIITVS
ncbi:MAG: MerR family DNA-binding protein [Acidimicrobiia bacterium]